MSGAARPGVDVGELELLAGEFNRRLAAVKACGDGIRWYPYGSLSNLTHLERLLTGERRKLLDLAGALPVADLGCADGDLAFFLESLGLRVEAFDWPEFNENHMDGVRALKQELASGVVVHELNLDRDFVLPSPRYGLAFFLGTLYHLKNPYHALERLARQVRYLVLSTRIAAQTPSGLPIAGEPVAYLLDRAEANNDWTNYWVFSRTGLRRILDRTGWTVLDWLETGAGDHADPARADADARAFALAASPLVKLEQRLILLNGWHEIEEGCWRWTARRFSVLLNAEPGLPSDSQLEFHFCLHPVLSRQLGPVTLRAAANGTPLEPETYPEEGMHCYRRRVHAPGPTRVEFELDRALPPSLKDRRELGLMVCFRPEVAGDGRLSDDPVYLAPGTANQ